MATSPVQRRRLRGGDPRRRRCADHGILKVPLPRRATLHRLRPAAGQRPVDRRGRLADDEPISPVLPSCTTVRGELDRPASKASGRQPAFGAVPPDDAGWVANRWCEFLPISSPAAPDGAADPLVGCVWSFLRGRRGQLKPAAIAPRAPQAEQQALLPRRQTSGLSGPKPTMRSSTPSISAGRSTPADQG